MYLVWSRDNVVGKVARLCAAQSGFDLHRAQDIFLSSKMSRPVLGPTQPSIQWTLEVYFRKVKQPGREADPPKVSE
jgi:hypothetical protein